jgi:FixJ family two-component response regulator
MADRAIRVAVIDDEVSVRKALARLLSAASFEPQTYGSAQEFLDSLKTHEPDCAIIDIHMPDISGFDLYRHLLREKRSIPVIVITAFDDAETRRQCLAAGAIRFLTKPLHGPALIEAIVVATREISRCPHPKVRPGCP